jgi:hypothetical protein
MKIKNVGKYEFLLEYPELGESNRWQQKNNPLEEVEKIDGQYFVEGYNPIKIDLNGSWWGGLVLSSFTCSLLDGSVGVSYWHYAIGQLDCAYHEKYVMPSDFREVNKTLLWIRVGNYRCTNNAANGIPFTKPLLFYVLVE